MGGNRGVVFEFERHVSAVDEVAGYDENVPKVDGWHCQSDGGGSRGIDFWSVGSGNESHGHGYEIGVNGWCDPDHEEVKTRCVMVPVVG